jgi:hypothetical protein
MTEAPAVDGTLAFPSPGVVVADDHAGYEVYAALMADPVLRNGHHIIIFSTHRSGGQDFPERTPC